MYSSSSESNGRGCNDRMEQVRRVTTDARGVDPGQSVTVTGA